MSSTNTNYLQVSYPYEANAEQGIVVKSYTNTVTVKKGGSFSISVTLSNNTSQDQSIYVKLLDNNGNVQDQVTDTINAGEEKTYTLNGKAPDYVSKFTYTIEYGVKSSG